jgi:hypothetical protein
MNDFSKETAAVEWFTKDREGETPKRPDGSIDFECLCGEFLVEGVTYKAVKEKYDALPSYLKLDV